MRVPNEKLREAVLESDLTLSEIARRAGWTREIGDVSRLKRSIGLSLADRRKQENISHANAVLLCDALGLDPVDVGI